MTTFSENKGFTMIELIIVLLILSILSVLTFSFINNGIKTYTMVKEQSALYSNGVYIMERITRELSDAGVVTSPLVGGSPSNTLTFTKVHTGHDIDHPWADPSTVVTFRLSGTNLLRNDIVINTNITMVKAFNVICMPIKDTTDQADTTIEVQLTLGSTKDTSIPSFQLTSSVTPNNYGTSPYTERFFNGDYYEEIE